LGFFTLFGSSAGIVSPGIPSPRVRPINTAAKLNVTSLLEVPYVSAPIKTRLSALFSSH